LPIIEKFFFGLSKVKWQRSQELGSWRKRQQKAGTMLHSDTTNLGLEYNWQANGAKVRFLLSVSFSNRPLSNKTSEGQRKKKNGVENPNRQLLFTNASYTYTRHKKSRAHTFLKSFPMLLMKRRR
jgi:hypothetical protein